MKVQWPFTELRRPAGLIQDQPRGLCTDFVIIDLELSLCLGAGRGKVISSPNIRSLCKNHIACAKLDISVSDKWVSSSDALGRLAC